MTTIEQKAAWAKELQDSEAMRWLLDEIREGALRDFENSARNQQDRREEAHATLSVLRLIDGTLKAAVSAETIEQKRNGKRG